MVKIVIVGAGGHAKTIVDTLERLNSFEIVGFIDQREVGVEVYRGYKIIGSDEDKEFIFNSGVHNAIIAVGFMGRSTLRNSLYEEYKSCGFVFPVIVDPTAIVAHDAVLCEGTYVGRNAVVNADARVGINCILNTASIVEHECEIGDFTHIAVAAVLCGQVQIGMNVLVGANATVLQTVVIGNNVTVGAGSVITKNIGDNVIVKNKKLLEFNPYCENGEKES